jgi:hypothetical protein
MRIFFDTEFIEDGRTIDLLSIGMVREDGATFYAEADWADKRRASQWVKDNVLPHLDGPTYSRGVMASEVQHFVGHKPEFWAYYADYDWVALCQLYGTMMDLPVGWPMYCRDFKQWLDAHGNPAMDEHRGVAHNALDDALHIKRNFDRLTALAAAQTKGQLCRKTGAEGEETNGGLADHGSSHLN